MRNEAQFVHCVFGKTAAARNDRNSPGKMFEGLCLPRLLESKMKFRKTCKVSEFTNHLAQKL